ncbi:MAG TPA: hypothetical protein VG604_01250 [Candidatus Saccharimonadales bacterium]|nr:hypothetical protein [Candidatus Saccharimonadales bacterium]
MKRSTWGRVIVGLLAFGVAGFLAVTTQASAATPRAGFNIVTSPLPIKIQTAPGKTVTTELRLNNQGNQPERIKVGLMKFGATGETGQPDLFDLKPTDTYASWVHFSPAEFTAQPNVWTSVKMTINIPPGASLGYYLAVTFSRANQPGVKATTQLHGAVATLVLLDVHTANEKRDLQVASFSTDHGLYEYLPANFNVKLHNGGNIYLTGSGNIFVQRGGKTVDTLDFNSAGGSVLPNSNRVFKVAWNNGFPYFKQRIVNGKPVNKYSLTWNFTKLNRFRIGHYTAKLLVVYDNGKTDVPLESTLSFWVLPWKLMLVGLVVLALIGYALFMLVRSIMGRGRNVHSRFRRKH